MPAAWLSGSGSPRPRTPLASRRRPQPARNRRQGQLGSLGAGGATQAPTGLKATRASPDVGRTSLNAGRPAATPPAAPPVRSREPQRRPASATLPRPARRRTSSCSETARRTGSARRAARSSRSCVSGTVDSSRARNSSSPTSGSSSTAPERAVAMNDPVDGLALRLEHVVEAGFDQLGDCGRGACRTCRRLGRACRATPGAGSTPARGAGAGAAISRARVGRGGSHAVEQDPLIVAVDPAHVDFQHPGRLDQFQPRQKPLHATDRRVRRAGLDAVQRRVRDRRRRRRPAH